MLCQQKNNSTYTECFRNFRYIKENRRAIEAGATGFREPADQPYGDRMAGVKDPFGYRWFLATHIRDISKEELEAMN